MVVDGVPCVAVHNFDGLLVARTEDGAAGKTVAEQPWKTDYANNIVPPAVAGQSVILSSGYNHQRMTRFDISLAGGAKKIWEVRASSKVGSPLIAQGHVYWAWRGVHCLDFDSGRLRWEGGQLGDPGSVILTRDDRLIVWGNRGDLLLIDSAVLSPDGYLARASRSVLRQSDAWPHVVLANGGLYCKDLSGNLLCFRL